MADAYALTGTYTKITAYSITGNTTVGPADVASFDDIIANGAPQELTREERLATQEADRAAEADARHAELAEKFSDIANRTAAEQIRAQYLEERGMTEESLAAAPPEVREQIEKEIAEEIKKRLGISEDAAPGTLSADNQNEDPAAELTASTVLDLLQP
jgi:HrpA-like RNA helicase